MVSQDSPPNPASNILHQFIISDSISNQTHFENQQFGAFGSDLRGNATYPQSLGILSSIHDLVQDPSMAEESEMSQRRHLMDLLGASNESNQHQHQHQHQRLSLSLGSRGLIQPVQYRLMNPNYFIHGEEAREVCNPSMENVRDDYNAFASSSMSLLRSCSTSHGSESFCVANSRYLKPAQSLLEEIVSVSGKAMDSSNENFVGRLSRNGRRGALGLYSELKAELSSDGFLSVEKQETQNKITRLVALLEEVESRYDEYYHQMEQVVSSFEMVAGLGAAKSYTALALQAMFRHFCSLRDAIMSQINVAKRKFSQDVPKINMGLSQLSLFDRETGSNRISLQQLGMVQSQRQAWRPIRGLPETSVAILRAWLFEHFLHPYPNDSEKLMLASQTGLSKNQVSNWFINARVRLWKPMIEEMYKEEFAESSIDSSPVSAGSSMT